MTDKLREALETVQQAAADLQRDMDRLAEIKATIRVNALRGGATTDEVEAMVRGEKSFVDFLAKLCDTRAALAAAPQPAPADREALVEVVAEELRATLGTTEATWLAEDVADALLARGLRLPGDETMAWAVVGEDGKIDLASLTNPYAIPMRSKGETRRRVAIRVVEGGDDAA